MASNPPDWHVGPLPPRRRTLWSDLGGLWGRFRGLPILLQLALAAVVLVLGVRLLAGLFGGDDGGTKVASRSTTSLRRAGTTTTSTTREIPPPLPAGDDKTVKSVIDGDSFELVDGTKVRLIGIDAPDTETNACFSAEATSHLKELLPADKAVRLVYDTTRTDRLNRTLAYVYRLPDALFINVAMARDGFAIEQNANNNTARQSEIATAVGDAKSASRGLWQSCSGTGSSTTVTTAASTATTATTSASSGSTSTTTTEAPSSTTTTSTEPSSTTTTLPPGPGVVTRNAPCVTVGASAMFNDGTAAVCTITVEEPTPPRWRPA